LVGEIPASSGDKGAKGAIDEIAKKFTSDQIVEVQKEAFAGKQH